MIIVGLGNPGVEFVGTRHNFGFLIVDALAEQLQLSWQEDRQVAYTRQGEHWLLKPLQYMNRSGTALGEFFRWHNISTDPAALHANLIVVHDELDFPLGTIRLQRDRSSAGHNGVQSIIDTFSTKDFSRLRLGIAQPEPSDIPSDVLVLQPFLPMERPIVKDIVDTATNRLRSLLTPITS